MGAWSDEDFAIEAAGRNHEQLAVHLHHRERRPARAAEALAVSSRRQMELPDFVFS
jgi:hypothetical protein